MTDSFFVRPSTCVMLNKCMLAGYRNMYRNFDHTVNTGVYDSFPHTSGGIFLDFDHSLSCSYNIYIRPETQSIFFSRSLTFQSVLFWDRWIPYPYTPACLPTNFIWNHFPQWNSAPWLKASFSFCFTLLFSNNHFSVIFLLFFSIALQLFLQCSWCSLNNYS